ncbi:Phospholipid-transporting ATPase [Entamoeba marina]
MYFLLNALTQLIPALKVGLTFTYFAPLVFVIVLAVAKDAIDEIRKRIRDVKINNEGFEILKNGVFQPIKSKKIKVGQILRIHKCQRVPADMVILQTSEKDGSCFIKTDQLDGETDWKFRRAIKEIQQLQIEELEQLVFSIDVEAPKKEIHNFTSRIRMEDNTVSLNIDNTSWANTVLASEFFVGIVVYTGKETRSSMNKNDKINVKAGRVDKGLNNVSKVLFVVMLSLSLLMIVPDLINGNISTFLIVIVVRFMVLYSSIIPISIRVNLDISKLVYSYFISTDKKISGAVVRNSTIPEELGQIQFLLSDKTGTLTKNEMSFKLLSLGTRTFSVENAEEIREDLYEVVNASTSPQILKNGTNHLLLECIRAMALCHNVTPTTTAEGERCYQASSPDEVALIEFSELVGVTLLEKTFANVVLNVEDTAENYEILNMFPFSSDTKRMGVIVKGKRGIVLYMKGADSVMEQLITNAEWLCEECEEYDIFAKEYAAASSAMSKREELITEVVSKIESNLELLCITGVEDELQDDVQRTLETLRHAGIRTWMLTGDKVETALCIAKSTRLVSIDQEVQQFFANSLDEVHELMQCFEPTISDDGLIVDGSTLALVLKELPKTFIKFALRAKSVICCRCIPTQKAEIVKLVKESGIRACAVGDGGNDVSMICEADVGLGVEGKEGRQAAMASDFSLQQFSHISRLLLWHGRNSYIRSSDLALFIMHRGMIISIMQAIFSCIFSFAPVALFQGFLLMGYSTYYTMLPVFSLILDERVTEDKVMEFPDLYRQLQTSQRLSIRNVVSWISLSILQAVVIMFLCMILFKDNFLNIVAISYTALILIQLLNVGFTIRRWNWVILLSEAISIGIYFISFFVLRSDFDLRFVFSFEFWWKLVVITLISSIPFFIKFAYQLIHPPKYMTLENRKCPISFNVRCSRLNFALFNPLLRGVNKIISYIKPQQLTE